MHSVVFKNDAVGDLVHSLKAISNIINALCLHYEFYVRRGKVGLPIGVFNGFSHQEPRPHSVLGR